jgi:hypothetical protein
MAHAQDDLAFEQDVNVSIDAGLDYLRSANAFTSMGNTERQARGLALLALLEKRESADPGAEILGYANSSVADQALARSAMTLIMNDTSYGVARAGFYAYTHGETLMALALYATTGGPEVVNNGGYTLRTAIDRLVDSTLSAQMSAGADAGFWGYTGAGNDSSTTQFAVAGLSAAKGFYMSMGDPAARLPGINAALALTRAGYAARQRADGGFGYRTTGYTSSYQQTASALWCTLLGGADVNDATAQGFLSWAKTNYNYQTIYAAYNHWTMSYYYYLWSSSKAYTLMQESGVPTSPAHVDYTELGTLPNAAITLDRADFRLANRDYLTDVDARIGGQAGKYAHYLDQLIKPLWYYDYAYTLMTQQDANGRFTATSMRNNGQTAINHGCWNTIACQSYAILVLERALGGACIDTDDDGICDSDDNCANAANPDQVDSDGDGLGDACDACPADPDNDIDADGVCGDVDNCEHQFNADQVDSDGDGAGDACDLCPLDPDDDVDQDGICGDVDNCVDIPNSIQEDTDADGMGDVCDVCPNDAENDIDLDGVCGDVDNCPVTANADQADADGDGAGDLCDVCPNDADDDIDADGVCGDVDNCVDLANPDQTDADADGAGDVCDVCPLDPNDDIDADGVCGDVDNCVDIANAMQADTDADGMGDVCDLCPNDADNDIDADGVCGDVDNCAVQANPDQADTDADGFGDVCDWCPLDPANDMDDDGICGDVDNCPADANSAQWDADADGMGDACDACPNDAANDADLDGVCGDVDNCPMDANADQADADGDGSGDVCDACPNDAANDADLDGVCGDVDNCPVTANGDQLDTDGDGAGDLCDVCPFDPDNDIDADGVCGDVDNCVDLANADQLDADGDGAGDVCDVCPLDADDDVDADGVCGDVDNCVNVANPDQVDADADGMGDVCDVCPLDADNDADQDDVCGDVDNCPDEPNADQADGDEDGAGDVCDDVCDAECFLIKKAKVKLEEPHNCRKHKHHRHHRHHAKKGQIQVHGTFALNDCGVEFDVAENGAVVFVDGDRYEVPPGALRVHRHGDKASYTERGDHGAKWSLDIDLRRNTWKFHANKVSTANQTPQDGLDVQVFFGEHSGAQTVPLRRSGHSHVWQYHARRGDRLCEAPREDRQCPNFSFDRDDDEDEDDDD